MTERDKLIEILKNDSCQSPMLCDPNCKYAKLERCYEERTADYLLENGVITLPCKLYDTVYLIVKGKAEIFEATVRRFSINQKCELIIVIEHKEDGWFKTGNYKWSSFGKWVFSNKKEAENALAGRNDK